MKYILSFLLIFIVSCENYNDIEDSALSNIVNDFILNNKPILKIDMITDSLSSFYPVYISKSLIPLYQVKLDDFWLFDDTLDNSYNDSIFVSLKNSKTLNDLEYKIFSKEIKFEDGRYRRILNPYPVKKNDGAYLDFRFSRICFDQGFTHGLISMDFLRQYKNGSSGETKLLLIKKTNDKWIILEKI